MTMRIPGHQFLVIGPHLVKKSSQEINIGAEIGLDLRLRDFIQQRNNEKIGGRA